MATPSLTPTHTRRLTSDEVWAMVEHGILEPDEPFELVDGELVYVSPQSAAHATVVVRLNRMLLGAYGEAADVRPQLPVGGIRDSIPGPDLAVARRDPAGGLAHPGGADMLLVIEVTRTSRRRDRQKVPIYARAGVPEYWRIDHEQATVEVHTGPRSDGTWDEVRILERDAVLDLPEVEGSIDMSEVFAGPVGMGRPDPGGEEAGRG